MPPPPPNFGNKLNAIAHNAFSMYGKEKHNFEINPETKKFGRCNVAYYAIYTFFFASPQAFWNHQDKSSFLDITIFNLLCKKHFKFLLNVCNKLVFSSALPCDDHTDPVSIFYPFLHAVRAAVPSQRSPPTGLYPTNKKVLSDGTKRKCKKENTHRLEVSDKIQHNLL